MKKTRILFIVLFLSLLTVLMTIKVLEKLEESNFNFRAILDKIISITGLLNFSLISVLSSSLLISAAIIIEIIGVGWKRSTLYRIIYCRSKSLYNDIISWLIIQIGLFDFLFFISTFGVFHYLSSFIFNSLNIRIDHFIDQPFMLAAIVFVMGDLKNYIFHRIMHWYPFWELHAFHHSATEFSIFTATRTHFLQKMISILLDTIMYALFQVPVTIFIGLTLFDQILQLLHHSEVNWNFGWIGRWIILSPKAHRIHHSKNPKHYHKNFGSFLIIWDKLFGTYHYTKEKIEIGISDNPFNKKGYLYDMFLGAKNFLFGILRLSGIRDDLKG